VNEADAAQLQATAHGADFIAFGYALRIERDPENDRPLGTDQLIDPILGDSLRYRVELPLLLKIRERDRVLAAPSLGGLN